MELSFLGTLVPWNFHSLTLIIGPIIVHDFLTRLAPITAMLYEGLYQNGPKSKRPRPKWPIIFGHVQNGSHRCLKRPVASTKRPKVMTITAQTKTADSFYKYVFWCCMYIVGYNWCIEKNSWHIQNARILKQLWKFVFCTFPITRQWWATK